MFFELLMEGTPEDLKLERACELGDERVFHEFLSKHPDAAKTLSEVDHRKLNAAAQRGGIATKTQQTGHHLSSR
jgi:hypothetical protein